MNKSDERQDKGMKVLLVKNICSPLIKIRPENSFLRKWKIDS